MNLKLKSNLETVGLIDYRGKLQFTLPVKTEFQRTESAHRSVVREDRSIGSVETGRSYGNTFWKDSGSRYNTWAKDHYIILPTFKRVLDMDKLLKIVCNRTKRNSW